MEALKLREGKYFSKNYFVEDSIGGFDGKLLHIESWIPDSKPRAVVLLVHSLGDHIDRYKHLAHYFNAENIAVMGIDLHGHGKSKGRRGIAKFQHLVFDVKRLTEYAHLRYPNLPKIIYGHGLGANLGLTYAIQHTPCITGIISSSPWIRTVNNPSQFFIASLRKIKRFFPSYTIKNRLTAKDLTHDHECVKKYNIDPLVHDKISVRLYFGIQESGEFLLQNKHKVNVPLLLMHGSNDKITSWHATSDFAKYTSANTTFKIWKGAYHELHNEVEKEDIFEYILNWINNLPGIN